MISYRWTLAKINKCLKTEWIIIPSRNLENFNAEELSAALAHPVIWRGGGRDKVVKRELLKLLLNKTRTFINDHEIRISRAYTA